MNDDRQAADQLPELRSEGSLMNICLVDVDSKIPNLALMKLSAWHKAHGDNVKFYEPLFDFPDRIYASKIFDFTPDFQYFPDDCEIIKGGTGYDMYAKLPEEAENMMPDYGLYGGCDYSIGRFTRGCPNRCPWCLVWRMDGNEIREVSRLSDFHDERHDTVRVLDDNIMANGDIFCHACEQLSAANVKTIWEALDIRLVTRDTARALSSVKTTGHFIHFAWDSHAQDAHIERGIKTLKDAGVKPYRLVFYVLVGFMSDREYDMYRIDTLRSLGAWPFVMPYDKRDRYQMDLARWCNNRFIFKSCSWKEYRCETNRRTR